MLPFYVSVFCAYTKGWCYRYIRHFIIYKYLLNKFFTNFYVLYAFTKKNQQGNRILYGIFHLLAVHQILQDRNTKNPRNPVFREYYEKKMSEGKTSGQAIICIARRLVNIIWGMMKNKSEYKLPDKPT